MKTITLQRKMDDGYGNIYCIQEQIFKLDEIHEYFDIDDEFKDVDSVVNFLEEKEETGDYDFLDDLKCNLDDSEEIEDFHSMANPNGYGNDVDKLVLLCEGDILFEL